MADALRIILNAKTESSIFENGLIYKLLLLLLL